MRWRLRSFLLFITILCLGFARYNYLQTKYSAVQSGGGLLYFDWQNPSITKRVMTFHQQRENKSVPVTMTTSQFQIAPEARNWTSKCFSALIENEPIAVQIGTDSLDSEMIKRIASMRRLETVLLPEASTVFEPLDPAVSELLDRMRRELPNVAIHVGKKRKE